jgi:hypothetical protein
MFTVYMGRMDAAWLYPQNAMQVSKYLPVPQFSLYAMQGSGSSRWQPR